MQVCRNATASAPCDPGTYNGDCKVNNKLSSVAVPHLALVACLPSPMWQHQRSRLHLIIGSLSLLQTRDKTKCGLQYSDQDNAAFCAIDNPSTWPPLLQAGPCNALLTLPILPWQRRHKSFHQPISASLHHRHRCHPATAVCQHAPDACHPSLSQMVT